MILERFLPFFPSRGFSSRQTRFLRAFFSQPDPPQGSFFRFVPLQTPGGKEKKKQKPNPKTRVDIYPTQPPEISHARARRCWRIMNGSFGVEKSPHLLVAFTISKLK